MSQAAARARRFAHAVWGAHRRLVTRVGSDLEADAGLDLDDFVLLEHVAHTDLTPGQLATTLRLSADGVSRQLGRLERRGLLRRALDPDDARRRRVRPTAAGGAALQRAYALLERRLSPTLGALGEDRLRDLLATLTALAAAEDDADTG